MRQVDAYSISKRQSIISENNKNISPATKRCSLLFEAARKNNKRSDILDLIKECSSNTNNSKIYGRSLAEIVSESNSLTGEFLLTIPTYESNVLNDILTSRNISDTIRNKVSDQLSYNEACDTIYENHCKISEEFDISEFVTEMNKPSINIITDKICEVVNRFNIPVYGKVQAAISESYYILSKFGIDFKEKALIDYISEYFLLSNGPYEDNMQIRAISESLENTFLKYVISEGMFDNEDKQESRIEYLCRNFTEKGDTSISAIDTFHSDIMKCDMSELSVEFNKYLNTLMRILLMPDEDESSNHIIHSIIVKIYMDTKSRNKNDLKNFLTRLDWHITKVDNYINDYEPDQKVKSRLEKYRDGLQDTRELLDADMDTLYTPYNELCIEFSNDAEPTTLHEYKLFKFDNLITRTYKLDKYIQNKVEPSRQKIFKYIKDKNNEIFGEASSIYDYLTPEGNIDYCVRSYTYDESSVDFNEVNSFLTDIIMEANESILNGTDLLCYYELTSDLVEFHIKDSTTIALDEDDKVIVENYLSREDENRMLKIFTAGSLINENFDYCNDSISYFSNPNLDSKVRIDKFKSFLETSAAIGVSKEIIRENYNKILYNLEGYNQSSFRYYGSYMVDSYIPESNNDLMEVLEAYNYTQYILELTHDPYTAVNTKNLQKYGYNGEDEKKKGYNDDDEDDRPAKPQRPNPTPHKAPEPEPEADDDYQDVQKNGPMANMTPTNIKLAGKAAGQRVRNAEAKVDRAFKMSDVIFNHFVKSCKDALVSDRREAIIKGSVIPSFSKCIKISIVLAGLGLLTGGLAAPVMAAIAGLIASKNLTKRERSLLLDDIEVEIQVIDKELQIADANNQINKYRALMKMKKDLQRQYQRIRTNIRMNKDFIPSKTAADSEY